MGRATQTAGEVRALTERLSTDVGRLKFGPPVVYVYNPLRYAAAPHRAYVDAYARGTKRVMFLGMNPGPYGMAQTGVPFGEVSTVRGWLGIDGEVGRPAPEHPKRPITGFACERSEVSGQRLWGLFAERYGTAKAFFQHHYVANYCPLVFMEESGKNRTPDKLSKDERKALYAACDAHLDGLLRALAPEVVVGVGAFAYQRAAAVVQDRARVCTLLHPSPASPLANQGWAVKATAQLVEAGIWEA